MSEKTEKTAEELVVGLDAVDFAVFGVLKNDNLITNPFRSEDGQYGVEPEDAYEVSAQFAQGVVGANAILEAAVEAAVEASCRFLRENLGIAGEGLAARHFSDRSAKAEISRALARYMAAEYSGSGMDVKVTI